jgi:hypothetical protein
LFPDVPESLAAKERWLCMLVWSARWCWLGLWMIRHYPKKYFEL